MSGSIELFERAAGAGAQLLRVEQYGAVLALTFDVGLVTVAPAAAGALVVAHPDSRDELPATPQSLDEEEPWWRLLGSPLTGVSSEGAAIRLRFRAVDDNPRTVLLGANGPTVAARLLPA